VHKGVLHYGDEFIGFMELRRPCWTPHHAVSMKDHERDRIAAAPSLRSSRTNVKKIVGRIIERCLKVIQDEKLDALIAMGGDVRSPSPSSWPSAA